MDLRIKCPQCAESFAVPDSLRGGVANCPKCRKLVDVPSAFEFVFWGGVLLALLGVLAMSWLVASFVSPWWAGVTAVVGIGIVIILTMCL